MFEKVLKNKVLAAAAGKLAAGKSVKLTGVWGSAGAMAAAALGRVTGRGVLFVTSHLDAADEVADDIEVFTGEAAQILPAWEVDVGSDHVSDEVIGERLRLCNLLSQPADQRDETVNYIVAPVMALLQPVPSREALATWRLELRKGRELGPDELAGWLVEADFENVEQVDQQGEFARRGGIVDIFPSGGAQALRIEFFGDRIESIRRFDLDTLRSTDEIASYDLLAWGKQSGPKLAAPGSQLGQAAQLTSYLPADTIVCIPEPQEVADLAKEVYDRIHSDLVGPDAPSAMHCVEDVLGALGAFAQVHLHAFRPKDSSGVLLDLGVRSLQQLSLNTAEALGELGELAATAQVWVFCENPAEASRFQELLAASPLDRPSRIRTRIGHIQCGFHWPAEKLVAVGHHEIFHRYAKRRRIRRVRMGRPIDSLLDLQVGDHVVHVGHGICKFDGLRTLERDGRSEEYLTLRFAANTVLHVPASRINLIHKYIGAKQRRVSLSRLGSLTWARQKKRVGEAVRDLAAEMLRIQALREAGKGISYPTGTDWQKQFAEEFIYSETPDQAKSMAEIDKDMGRARPMDRLLCGDVGFGKTELAMRAAFRIVEAGKQVAVLVPTTVLASQHGRTFKERFADYPINVDVISRLRPPGRQKEILKRVKLGQIDIIIGTHRLLSKDMAFADLGLVIIDEEQRFGVEHKEHLKRMRATVEMLTMTATPIPRTLHMALLGLRDISSLATAPLDRRAIRTEVCHYDDRLVRTTILRELNRNGQVFFVHNRVMDIEPLAERIRALVPEARISVAHGQMPDTKLESTMLEFVARRIDVLVCTSIIESGLDIPTANTMIIHDADRFGLSELHQLRGRVGRYKHRAYCYLLLPDSRPVTPVAAKRLKAIEEFSDLGAGFQIAIRDLEIRGAGNILGPQQSGHIATVGYELYCGLLADAVRKLRGEPVAPRRETHLELGIEAYIPRSYIPSQRQRMEIYRRLVRCSGPDDLKQLTDDLKDAYGPVPTQVDILMDAAEVRVRAAVAGIDSIIRMDPDIIFSIRDMAASRGVFEGAAGSVRLVDEKTVYWRPPKAYMEMPTLLRVLLKRLK